ncbi:extracellular solute-binding protein [Bacillus sp. FJAT-49711]|uniref:extracellular solute-binding protein n=1 Tax=Bacillus sp. FJAT-49711 TaxID=2833585 RepID=UPI001BC9A072|nr:extracellular solute-binding protein [Bacillus sp. FJAT-49711]MBS4220215.1 extracellular solute-binding protein [Bacillus sp. FJAT-49711]
MLGRLSKLLFVVLLVIGIIAGCNTSSEKTGGTNNQNESANNDESDNGSEEKANESTEDYGDTGGIKLPIVDKPVEITWMLVSEVNNLKDKAIIKEIEKRTGIKLNIQEYSSGTYSEKLNTVVASGQLPDIWHGLPVAKVNELGQKGAVVAINEYLDELPNYKKLYAEENDWVMKSFSDDKGNMYTWPIYGVNRDVNHGFLYRKDIFDKHGIELWNNTEEFYQALKKLKEEYPDSAPYSSKTAEFIFRDWGFGWGITGAQYPAYFDETDKTWKFQFTDQKHKDMLDFMKKLYNEGLLDKEFITDTEASWTTKMTTGKSFVTFDWIGRLDMFYEQVKADNSEYDLRYGNPVGPENTIRSLDKIANWGHTVTKNDKSEIALKLLDYLSSPSGAELIMVGIKDEIYKEDGDGKITYPDLNLDVVGIKDLENQYGMWLEGMYLRADERSVYFNYTEKEQEAQDMMQGKMQPIDPILKFNDKENDTIAKLQPNLLTAGIEFSTKYVMTKSYGDKEWDAWLEEAKRLKVDDFVQVYNDAQKRFDSE